MKRFKDTQSDILCGKWTSLPNTKIRLRFNVGGARPTQRRISARFLEFRPFVFKEYS